MSVWLGRGCALAVVLFFGIVQIFVERSLLERGTLNLLSRFIIPGTGLVTHTHRSKKGLEYQVSEC